MRRDARDVQNANHIRHGANSPRPRAKRTQAGDERIAGGALGGDPGWGSAKNENGLETGVLEANREGAGRSSLMKHAYRIMILMGTTGLMLGWFITHSEPSSNIGLRDIRQAEQFDRGAWRDGLFRGIDHPLHPLLIAGAHELIGGGTSGSWQRAALLLCFTCGILLVIPIYLLALELFDGETAWLACLLIVANPIIGFIVLNVLSESTFLLSWTFGLWAAVRFLRDGAVPLASPGDWLRSARVSDSSRGDALAGRACGDVAALAGLAGDADQLAPVAASARVSGGGARVSGRAVCRTQGGPGNQAADRAGAGTGTARPRPLALEREAPLPPSQTAFESHRVAAIRVLEILRDSVTLPLVPFAIVGLILAGRSAARTRAALFLAIVLAGSAIGLVRLHATAGYCSPRHALRSRHASDPGGRACDDRDGAKGLNSRSVARPGQRQPASRVRPSGPHCWPVWSWPQFTCVWDR